MVGLTTGTRAPHIDELETERAHAFEETVQAGLVEVGTQHRAVPFRDRTHIRESLRDSRRPVATDPDLEAHDVSMQAFRHERITRGR